MIAWHAFTCLLDILPFSAYSLANKYLDHLASEIPGALIIFLFFFLFVWGFLAPFSPELGDLFLLF